jgi:spore coat polysaccharide biosynthesis predicted glycosyltransferase SpsG/GNAT superfamily N-acetyltransferase
MSPKMTVRLLTEAGPSIGLGHLCRCVALYDALQSRGAECEIVLDGTAPAHVVGDRATRECAWLLPTTIGDILHGVDVAVLDSYRADLALYEVAASSASVAVYLDDTARIAYPRGIVVNGNPAADTLLWPEMTAATRLLGVEYQLLRSEFVGIPGRDVRPTVDRVLVVSGGTDVTVTLQEFVALARQAYPGAHIDVAAGTRTAQEMCHAMLAADVALSAAGQTLYELAAAGTPVVAVTVADNQTSQANALEHAGALLLAGPWGADSTSSRVLEMLEELQDPRRRASLSTDARSLVDGMGADRVARTAAGSALRMRLEIRDACREDEEVLLALANDPVVRATALSTRLIGNEEHHSWFEQRLANPADPTLLAWDGAELVAYVRFDSVENAVEISIGVAERYRGFRLGPYLIERALSILRERRPDNRHVTAWVRADNWPSATAFVSAGFTEEPCVVGRDGYRCYQWHW